MELLRILFVEDLETDYELAQWYLRKDDLSFDSICVDTKQEFINALDEFQPELIISDYSMPEFNGMQALQITLENHPEIPFIVLTGSINEETAVQCMRAGAADYVLKEKMHRLPFSVRETLKRDKERRERIAAENQLRVSEEKFRDIFESANVGKAITSTTETIAVNDALADMLGYTREELLAISWEKLTYPDDFPYTKEKVDALHRGEVDAVRYEKRYIHKKGHLVWVDISVKTHRNSDGKVEYIFSTIIDISEKKIAEEKLRESETRFRMLFDQAPVGYQSLDEEGKFIDVNSTWLEILGYEREEVIGRWFGDFLAKSCLDTYQESFARFLKEGSIQSEFEMIKKDQSLIQVAFEGRIGYDGQGGFKQTHCIMQDITESKKAEIARKESEKRYRHLFEDSPVAIFEEDFSAAKHYIDALREKGVTDFQEYFTSHPEDLSNIVGLVKVTDVNQASLLLYGAQNKEELLSELKKEIPLEDSILFMDEIVNVANGLTRFYYETSLKDLKGKTHFLVINWAATPGYVDDLSKVILTLIDITERKEAEQALREGEQRYRNIFEESPVSIWEEDFSKVKKRLDELKADGIEDFNEYFNSNRTELLQIAELIEVIDVNQETIKLFGARNKHDLRNNFTNIYTEHSLDQLIEELVCIANGETKFDIDFTNKTVDGRVLEFSAKWAAMPGYEENLSKVLISMVDITDRKKAEESLRENEQRYRSLFNDSPVAIFEEDFSAVKTLIDELKQSGVEDFREFLNTHPDELANLIHHIKIVDINKEAEKLYGFHSKEDLNGHIEPVASPFNIYLMVDELVNIANGLTKFQTEVFKPDPLGNPIFLTVNWAAVPGFEKNLSKVIVSVVDITERKELEKRQQERLAEMEAIDKITTALREASTKEQALPIFLQETLSMMQVKMGSIWLYQKGTDTLQVSHVIGCEDDLQTMQIKPGEGVVGKVFQEGKTFFSSNFMSEADLHPCFEEHIDNGMGGICVPIQSREEELGVILIVYPKDREVKFDEVRILEAFARIAGITLQRMVLYEDTLSHLKQLQVQRAIDQTIASIFDLNLTLDIISSHARNYLNADATGILLFHPRELTLNFVAGNGFRTTLYKNTRIPLGAGPAGKAALSREIIPVKNLLHSDPPFKTVNFLIEERFVSYLAVPLIAKGELKGVIEIFYRAETDFREDMLDFIESLAFQTAIAIDNLQLFENLQQSNQELVQAYDATIEGWSRAMDLRDKETENHTIRVTEMAVRISRIMGVKEEEIIHIRRGALLHDIGKIGVPDEILHKPGPLTPEEWVIMKQHPIFAYEMIAPVDYLKPALDIPYCHHEKWDGSGYPRGLRGEEIPIAGRIFAVIDVWDALMSDRPYRKAWERERVIDYIKEQSGTHFDPEIVKIFLEVVESEDWFDE